MNTKSTECWSTDTHARALRLELSPSQILLLPFDQFLHAELVVAEQAQRLMLVFATHEVVVEGHSLRRVLHALQRLELASVALVPVPLRRALLDGDPVITGLTASFMQTTSE